MANDIDRFYELLRALEAQPGQGQRLADCTGRCAWPARGVYFFREPGEFRRDRPECPRIVRVGTHAVSTGSRSTLWSRLRAHRGSRDGTGNHRGSIFRLHAGAALLERDGEAMENVSTWAVGSSAPRAVRNAEVAHERRVSRYLGAMTVLWVEIPDEPGPRSLRAHIERNAIALLSSKMIPPDPPSEEWLGLHSSRPEIRTSGLWNLNFVRDRYDPAFVDVLASLVSKAVQRQRLGGALEKRL